MVAIYCFKKALFTMVKVHKLSMVCLSLCVEFRWWLLAACTKQQRKGTLVENDIDYRKFDIVQRFVDAVYWFEYDLADRMPIWIRMPLLYAEHHRFPIWTGGRSNL